VGVERFHLWSEQALKTNFDRGETSEDVKPLDLIIHHNSELYLPRKKTLFKRAPFICLDRDIDENAPDHLAAIQSLNNSDFLRVFCQDLGGDVARAFYPSCHLRHCELALDTLKIKILKY